MGRNKIEIILRQPTAKNTMAMTTLIKPALSPKGESAGLMRVVMAVVFFAVGCLNIISILFRPISLSFSLYGNTFAGENMMETMAGLVPGLGWLLPIPFY